MTDPSLQTSEALSLSAEFRVDAACVRFEAEWKAGRRPRIEDFLGDAREAERLALLRELIVLDFGYRRRLNETPAPDEYLERFPELGDAQIADLFLPPPERSEPILISPAENAIIAGRYTLLQKIGEGGMGEVWVAKQTEPVKRKVALKLIKAGMDSKAVLQRFEQERQALAMMDHPNIAKVLDGGLTDDRRPFFVMELVNGLSLTKFCDDAKLTTRERLELFVPICQAVQHAHQKGIVHRDLKPSNILITLYDGRPIPKVIDFGVAKAVSGKLTDESLSTQFGAVVGTLEYMSPEQAGYSVDDIDTRADIYSLGVILYELLTGLRPIDANRLKKAAFTEMLRIIQEEEPSKPSTRLSTDESLPSLAALRQIEPKKLMALLRGELDWVVMKCLEKQRDRRYETVNGLARDIQRYLADEPVEARPPSAGYRVGKFLKRNKGPVVAAGVVLLVLVAGMVGTTWGLIRAVAAEGIARKRFDEAEIARSKADASAKAETEEREKAEKAEAETLADYRASTDDAIEKLIGSKPVLGPKEKAYLENTLKRWHAFANRQGGDVRSRAIRVEGYSRVAQLWERLGRKSEAMSAYETARDLQKSLAEQYPTDPLYRQRLGFIHNALGSLLDDLRMGDKAREEYRAACDIRKTLVEQFPDVPAYQKELANAHNNLGVLLASLGKSKEARSEFEAVRDTLRKLVERFPTLVECQPELAGAHNNLALLLATLGDNDAALAEYRASRDIKKKLVEQFPGEPKYQRLLAATHINLGSLLDRLGKRKDSQIEYEAARDLLTKLVEQLGAYPKRGDVGREY